MKKVWVYVIFVLLLHGLIPASSSARPDKTETSEHDVIVRFRIAALDDLRTRLLHSRAKAEGVWARITLTRELIFTELELARLQEYLKGDDQTESGDKSGSEAKEKRELSPRETEKAKKRRKSSSRKGRTRRSRR